MGKMRQNLDLGLSLGQTVVAEAAVMRQVVSQFVTTQVSQAFQAIKNKLPIA